MHRLVAEGFLGKQDGLDVNHIDGNKKNNNLLNLEFCTRQKNVEHAIKNGLNNRKTPVKIVETGEIFDCIKFAMQRYDVKWHASFTVALDDPKRTAAGLHWTRVL